MERFLDQAFFIALKAKLLQGMTYLYIDFLGL